MTKTTSLRDVAAELRILVPRAADGEPPLGPRFGEHATREAEEDGAP